MMTIETFIELFGYLGSFIVLISFLMTSVVKLRIVNSIGSLIFMIYALIIKSYPTAIMNFCLILINIHFLYKMFKTKKDYDIVEIKKDDALFNYLLNRYEDDIKKCFPNIDLSLDEMNKGFIVLHEGNPVGITIGKLKNHIYELILDYSLPLYRDSSIGYYLYSKLSQYDIKRVIYKGSTENHLSYLEKMGFRKFNDIYEKDLNE